MLAQLSSTNKPNQPAYKSFINKKCSSPGKSQAKWIRDCKSEDVKKFDWRSKLKFQTQIFVAFAKKPKQTLIHLF